MDKPELAKYQALYSEYLAAIVEVHNTHVTFIANPNMYTAGDARREIASITKLLAGLRGTNKHVYNEHVCVAKQEHVQQKELARTTRLTKKGKIK